MFIFFQKINKDSITMQSINEIASTEATANIITTGKFLIKYWKIFTLSIWLDFGFVLKVFLKLIK